MDILITDGMDKEGLEVLKRFKINYVLERCSPEELLKVIHIYNGLIIRSRTRVTKEVIEKAKNLLIVGRAGVGTDNIDIEAASDNGILVKYAPHGNSISTAELAFGLMLSLARNIPQATMT